MSNEIVNMNELLQVTQNTAMSVSSISEQMGLVVSRVNQNTKRIIALEDRITSHERTEVVNRAQANRLHEAIQSRATFLLGIEFEGGVVSDDSVPDEVRYRSAFINKCHVDARRHSKLGKPYYATLKVDFDETLAYIESWVPEVTGGTEGYKHYLDVRREERMKKSA